MSNGFYKNDEDAAIALLCENFTIESPHTT